VLGPLGTVPQLVFLFPNGSPVVHLRLREGHRPRRGRGSGWHNGILCVLGVDHALSELMRNVAPQVVLHKCVPAPPSSQAKQYLRRKTCLQASHDAARSKPCRCDMVQTCAVQERAHILANSCDRKGGDGGAKRNEQFRARHTCT
jgi:hypothetical protein